MLDVLKISKADIGWEKIGELSNNNTLYTLLSKHHSSLGHSNKLINNDSLHIHITINEVQEEITHGLALK